jgi:aryl-alcohol dehydrogenase-like predicted oxidoreductase
MQRVELGRTGIKVGVVGLGAGGDSRLGLKQAGADSSVRLVRAALDLGIDFIDTAEAYGTEEVVGRAIAEVPRDRVVISTKKSTFNTSALEPKDVVQSLEASLRRLNTDYIDVYHLHAVRPGSYASLRERLLPTLQDLRTQGKIRFIGLTEAFNADPKHEVLVEALRDDDWDVVMVGFNALNQSARERVFPATLDKRVGTLIMFAVRRALSRPDRLRELLQDLAARGTISREVAEQGLDFVLGAGGASSLPDAAYRFVRDEPGAHVILSGTGDEAHLRENVRSLDAPPLPAATRARLIELFQGVDDVSGH